MNLDLWLQRTMLIERLSGVLAYVIVIMCGYSRILHTADSKNLKRVFAGLCIALGVMGFLYVPGDAADLCEWQKMYERYWASYSLTEFIKGPMLDSKTPISYLLIYICESTGIHGILPGIVAIVFFGFVFSVFRKTALDCTLKTQPQDRGDSLFKASSRRTDTAFCLALTFLFFMSSGSFLEAISGVRCFTALAIIAWCIYGELVGEKTLIKNLFWYGVACLMHLAAIPVFVVRLLYLLVGQLGNKAPKVGNYITAVFISIAGLVFGSRFLMYAFDKGVSYLNNNFYTYTWEYIIGFIQLIIILVTLVKYRKLKDEEGMKKLRPMVQFNAFMCAIEICFCFEYTIFHRFILFSSIIILPVMYGVLQHHMQNKNYSYVNLVRVLSVVMLALACVRGNLCGYKFFELNL